MNTPNPLFIAPTSAEYAAVKKALDVAIAHGAVQLMSCGVGEKKSDEFARQIHRDAVSCLVLIGWGGGLSPDLAAGDLVCAETALREGQPRVSCAVLPIHLCRIGPILTAAESLSTPAAKRSAGSTGALAVEMEAYPLAVWTSQQGLPFYHFRVILDTLEETLPDLGQGLNPSGGLRPVPFVTRLVKQPSLVKELWGLYQRVNALNPILERLVENVLQQLVIP